MKNISLIALTFGIWATSSFADERYFINVDAEIDGKSIKMACERQGMKAVKEFGDNFYPSPANKYRSYQLSCAQNGGKFGGTSFKINSSLDPVKETITPYDGSTAWESLDKAFTVRVADGSGKEIQIHSFLNSTDRKINQHYTGAPELKITEFQVVEEGGKTFHIIAGSLKAEFEQKPIKGKDIGSKGKVALSFRNKFKFVSDIMPKK